jgi:hypothetical protein
MRSAKFFDLMSEVMIRYFSLSKYIDLIDRNPITPQMPNKLFARIPDSTYSSNDLGIFLALTRLADNQNCRIKPNMFVAIFINLKALTSW